MFIAEVGWIAMKATDSAILGHTKVGNPHGS